MFIMAIAGGLAYNYDNYVSRVKTHKGKFRDVIKDTIRTFRKDSRLIKPKKFGFDASHLEEREMLEIRDISRKSVKAEIKIQ